MVKDGEVVKETMGKTIWVDPQVDEDAMKSFLEEIKPEFEKYYSIRFSNYPVSDRYLPRQERIIVGG